MALTLKDLPVVDVIRTGIINAKLGYFPQAWLVGERVEDEFIVFEYEYENKYYELYYEFSYGTWTTPSGDVKPCRNQTRILTKIKVMDKNPNIKSSNDE